MVASNNEFLFAYSNILTNRSDVFKKMFANNMEESTKKEIKFDNSIQAFRIVFTIFICRKN